jgi:hypothetical protein
MGLAVLDRLFDIPPVFLVTSPLVRGPPFLAPQFCKAVSLFELRDELHRCIFDGFYDVPDG